MCINLPHGYSRVLLRMCLRGGDVHVAGSVAAAKANEALGGFGSTYRPTKKEVAAIGDPLMVFQNLTRCNPVPATNVGTAAATNGGDALDRLETFVLNLESNVNAIEVFLKVPKRRLSNTGSGVLNLGEDENVAAGDGSAASQNDKPYNLVQCYTLIISRT